MQRFDDSSFPRSKGRCKMIVLSSNAIGTDPKTKDDGKSTLSSSL